MLKRLFIQNYAIIDRLDLTLEGGLSTITGETGAGKSILLGALKLVLGERADLQSLGDLTNKCVIEAEFSLKNLGLTVFFEENDLDYEDLSIFRREILPSGKSRAFVNDSPVTLSVLQELSDRLIDIHSQFNTRQILNYEYQLELLDAVAGNLNLRKDYQLHYKEFKHSEKQLNQLRIKLQEESEKADFRNFLAEELNAANLQSGELETLEEELALLEHAEAIGEYSAEALQLIQNEEVGISNQLREVVKKLEKNAEFSKDFQELAERANTLEIELRELELELQSRLNATESRPERLAEVQQRLELIYALQAKHRVQSMDALIKIQYSLNQDIENFDTLETQIFELEKKVEKQTELLNEQAVALRENRKNAVPKLQEELLATLARLGMENSRLEVHLQSTEAFTVFGKDEILLHFSANKGQNLKPIQHAVSGGEMSRLMLAIKKMLAGRLELPTLILDEIDTGVSGKIANEMGNIMQEMGADMQVLAITHLPQVAAKGRQQYKVYKTLANDKTLSGMKKLTPEERINEIAALISGSEISGIAKMQAEELLGNP